jgi:NAD+ synthase
MMNNMGQNYCSGGKSMNNALKSFSRENLELDEAGEVERIIKMMRETVLLKFHRQGAVVNLSGDLDSAVVMALSVLAFGPARVLGVGILEKETSEENLRSRKDQAELLGIRTITEDITSLLIAFGCYQRRDEIIKKLFPRYSLGWKYRIMLPVDLLGHGSLNIFRLVLQDTDGVEYHQRLPLQEFRQLIAADNFKQHVKMAILYYHAEESHFAVIGTNNKSEIELGGTLKYGEGCGDIFPIGHLLKTQIFQLARYLEVQEDIIERVPATDPYLDISYLETVPYRLPVDILDTILMGFELGISEAQIAGSVGLKAEQVAEVVQKIGAKHKTNEYLRSPV